MAISAVWGVIWVAALTFAFTRFALAQREVDRDIRDLRAIDRQFRTAARMVRVVGREGTMIAVGVGERATEVFELHAIAFELRVEDGGEVLPIEAGAKLRVIVRGGSFQGGVLRVPAGQLLLCRMPPLVESGDAVAALLRVLRGEPITLLDPQVDLFFFVRRTRVASGRRSAAVIAAVLFLLALDLWPLTLVAFATFFVDQAALRGSMFSVACTRWRDPEYWRGRT